LAHEPFADVFFGEPEDPYGEHDYLPDSPLWTLQDRGQALPTTYENLPGDVATAEICFREPDGWISTVLRDSIWAQQKRDSGLEEVLCSAPDFLPPIAASGSWPQRPVVVPSYPKERIPDDEAQVAVDWGTIFSGAVDIWQGQQVGGAPTVYNAPLQYGGGTALPSVTPTAMNGSCGCNSSPCVCGTINGRAALVDPRTGKRCYRRRRRVMLTEGDFNTLLRISTLPNTKNVSVALAKAIGRR